MGQMRKIILRCFLKEVGRRRRERSGGLCKRTHTSSVVSNSSSYSRSSSSRSRSRSRSRSSSSTFCLAPRVCWCMHSLTHFYHVFEREKTPTQIVINQYIRGTIGDSSKRHTYLTPPQEARAEAKKKYVRPDPPKSPASHAMIDEKQKENGRKEETKE